MTDEQRIEWTMRTLQQAAQEAGAFITGDMRVGEEVAAELLGVASGTLANKRSEGTAPPHYRLSGGGHRVTYRLWDLAAWIESART